MTWLLVKSQSGQNQLILKGKICLCYINVYTMLLPFVSREYFPLVMWQKSDLKTELEIIYNIRDQIVKKTKEKSKNKEKHLKNK